MTTSDPTTRVDPYRSTPARLHNAILGGKDHYTPDEALAAALTDKIAVAITESRLFVRRAVEYLIDHHGVSQFVELGCGLPHAPNIHEIAEHRIGTARTLYVDSDPLVATHGRALLSGPNCFFTDTDVTDTATVLANITAVMDMSAPLAVCLSGTAELIGDAPAVVAALTDQLPTGTWIVFTHIADDVTAHQIYSAAQTLRGAGLTFHPRGHEAIAAMLTGYRLLAPGQLIAPHRWRPTTGTGDDGDGDDVHHFSSAKARHPAASELSAYAAVGQLYRPGDTPR